MNKLVKVAVDKDNRFSHIVSDEKYKEWLLKCIIVSDDLVLTLRPHAAFIHDASTLERKHEVQWEDVLPFKNNGLAYYGSTTSHSSMDCSSCIGSFDIYKEDVGEISCKSVNNEWHSKEEDNKGRNYCIVRFKLNEEGNSIQV